MQTGKKNALLKMLVFGVVLIVGLSIILVSCSSLKAKKIWNKSPLPAIPSDLNATSKIHFLNVGGTDAILLESNGHFALIDSGEDTDNPRGFEDLNLTGYEQIVLSYLKSHAADENARVHLDFVLGTHSHSDHIGGFDTIILDDAVTIDRAYLKEYDSSKISDYEVANWDNQEVYDQMVNALRTRGVPVVSEIDNTPFALGDFVITIFNAEDQPQEGKVGENDNSLGVLVEKNGTRIFLAGDMDNYSGDETRLAPQIGKVDLLKVGHHGAGGSSSDDFISTLLPTACVITNNRIVEPKTVLRIVNICNHERIYFTGKENGVLAVVGDGGDISYYGNLH